MTLPPQSLPPYASPEFFSADLAAARAELGILGLALELLPESADWPADPAARRHVLALLLWLAAAVRRGGLVRALPEVIQARPGRRWPIGEGPATAAEWVLSHADAVVTVATADLTPSQADAWREAVERMPAEPAPFVEDADGTFGAAGVVDAAGPLADAVLSGLSDLWRARAEAGEPPQGVPLDAVLRAVAEAEAELTRAVYLRAGEGVPPEGLPLPGREGQPAERPPGAAPSPPARADGPYLFVRAGAHWRVRFAGGEEFLLPDQRGMAYLHLLLGRQGRPIPAARLVREAMPPGAAPNRANSAAVRDGSASLREVDVPDTAEAPADSIALAAYRAELADLQVGLARARADNDDAASLRLAGEIDALLAELRRNGAVAHEADRVVADRKRVVGAVGNAVRRAVEHIRRHDRALARHLSHPVLQCGANPCYNPPERLDWVT